MADKEGVHLAGRHAAQGVIAFVLRYRVRHTWEGDEEMRRCTVDLDVRTRGTPRSARRRAIIGEETDHAATLGMADGRQRSATSGTMPGNGESTRAGSAWWVSPPAAP
jgi:hypothetical protein